ncbi:dual serine/threonine and tyrosine protein kinase-like [Aricia agestis]|uniref:dual serine/threonine and tyrosine protein kinase-like n=1 Tax=Aricia agestis TaxID=91739 RepID=UPI001C2021E1|nr:dual serine/threonine and tyrosine protein kinase-like [Aricia agestis]
MGGSGMARRTAARARVLRLLLRDTMRALQDLCPAPPPNAPDVSGVVAELSRLAARPAALVVLGSTASARARLVNCLLGARLLPDDLPRGCRWIRIQFGSSTQAHLTLGNSEFELVDELECNRRPWDTLPLQDVLRQDPSDNSTMLEVELNNSFLKTGHRIIIPPDIASDPGPSTYSTLKQLHADLFAKREAILKNFNPVYLYALDSFGSNIFNENLSLAKYTPSRSEEEFWNTFNLHYMARMGAGEEMRVDKAEEMFEETLMGMDDNAVFTPENCLDLHQIKELDPNSQVYFILFADSVSGPDGRPDIAPDVTESAGSGESTYNADDLPESDQDFADGALRNTESQEHIPRVTLEERQVSFMNDLLDQWELLTSPPPKHHVGSTWSIVDEQAFNTELDESRYGERVVRTRSGLIRAVQRYAADVAHTQLLVQCTKLSEIHVKLLQQFLLSSFELARELQVVPRNIHYAAHMERQLYEMITEKFSMGEKRRELLRLVEEVLRDLRPHLEQVDWSVDDLPCHQDKRFTVSSSIFYSSRSSIDVRPDPDRPVRTGPDRSDSEAEEAASCYEFDDYEIIDSADEGLCVSESIGYILNSEAGSSMLSVCSGTNLSSKQASLDVQRAVLSKLSRMISLKLVNFVDCLKETYFGTLQRCIENLECVSSSAGGRAASGAVRQLLAAVRAVDLEPAADASLLPRLWDALRRLVYRLCVPYEEEGVCCVLSPQWRRRTALATLDSLTPARLTRLISTQILERLSAAHERYQAALSALAAALTARLDHTMDAKYNIRRKVAPRFARLCLESTSMCDLLKYGNPELGREIGRGQYGVVYAVRGSWGGHAPAAVKSVRPPDDRAYRDLAMEFFYTRSIPAHPRIVQLLGSVVQRGGGGAGVLLVSRRYSRDLHAAVAAGLPLPARMAVAADIVEGIRYLHSLGLIHRDIKLKNVLLDTNNRAALADLGFCALGPLLGGSVVGTPVHMAPELLGGEYDTAVDVYAFAVLFWYLCAGTVRLPAAFETFQNKQQLWTKVKRGLRPERLPHFTDEMWDIMTSCWAPDPAARALLGDVQPRIERILEWARDLPPESEVAKDEWSGASDSDIC